MRKKLSNEEFNAIAHLTSATKMDSVFDVCGNEDYDYFIDFEEGEDITLEEGLQYLYEGIAYPCSHDGLTEEEGTLIADMLIEFEIADKDWKEWYLQ